MMMVDRGDFCSEENKINCYNDSPSSIGYNQTISAPHMHAMALNYLTENGHIKKGSKVLDVGCGSGYLTAAFAYLAEVNEKDGGLVVGIDILPDLVKLSEDNIRKHNKDLLESGQIIILTQDGWKGYPLESYDAIHVGATAESFPKELWNQLKPGGRIFIPI